MKFNFLFKHKSILVILLIFLFHMKSQANLLVNDVWNQVNQGTFQVKTPVDLFLARLAAYERLIGPDHIQAKKFLLETMTIHENDYEFEKKIQFIKTVKSWSEPKILAWKDTADLCAVLYQIPYQDDAGEHILHEISFFSKDHLNHYFYNRKVDLSIIENSSPFKADQLIRQYGDPVLTSEAVAVHPSTNQDDIQKQILIMQNALFKTGGVGIATNQCKEIPSPLQIILSGVDYTNDIHVKNALRRYPTTLFPQMRVLINPKILSTSGESLFSEGCLSFFGPLRGQIIRPSTVKISYYLLNQNVLEKPHEEIFEGDDARVIQHEIDHIQEGKVFIDHVLSRLNPSQINRLDQVAKNTLDQKKFFDSTHLRTKNEPQLIFAFDSLNNLNFNDDSLKIVFEDCLESSLLGLSKRCNSNFFK